MTEPDPDAESESYNAEHASVANRVRLFDMLLIAQHVSFAEDDERKALMDALRTGLHRLFESEGGSAS